MKVSLLVLILQFTLVSAFDWVVLIGWLPAIIVNTFFGSLLKPVVDKLCLDFEINFQLIGLVDCQCEGGVTASLTFAGDGVCTVNPNNGNDVCWQSVCGEGLIYPSVETDRIRVWKLITGSVPQAVEAFDLEATAILNGELTVDIKATGSISQCRVDVASVTAEFQGEACQAELIDFVVEDPTCTNNENEEHYYDVDCGDGLSGIIDIGLQDRTPME